MKRKTKIYMRKYQGVGTISFPKMPSLNGDFELLFEDSSKTTLHFTTANTAAMKYNTLPSVQGKFSGTSTSPNCQIIIDPLYLDTIKVTFSKTFEAKFDFNIWHTAKIVYQPLNDADDIEIRRGLSNLIFYGTEMIKYGQTSLWGMTTCKLAGQEVCLVQLQDFEAIIKELKESKDVRTTCELILKGTYGNLTTLRETYKNIQNLCSLASGNYVTGMYDDIYQNGKLCETYLFPLKTYPFSKSPSLIDNSIFGNKEFKTYLETTYGNYQTYKNILGLSYVIEFFISSKMSLPMEAQYVLTTTAFECLERYYRDWQKLLDLRSLRSKIERMLSGPLAVTHTKKELISYRDNRNSIIHEGRFPSTSNGFVALMELRNLLDRVLLSILGYKNKPYYNVLTKKKEMLV
jgi:hypothetical protein